MFQLAEAFVSITGDDRPFRSSLTRVRGALAATLPAIERVASAAKWMLVGLGGALIFAGREAANAERSIAKLQASLEATGQADQLERLLGLSARIQAVTVYGDDEVTALQAYAASLGVTADAMEEVVKNGVGLANAVFDGNLERGIEAATLAFNGNFNQLQRFVPAIRNAKTESEKLAAVQKLASVGWRIATRDATTFGGSMRRLWNAVGDLGEVIGNMFVPYINRAANGMRVLIEIAQRMTASQKQMIVRWTAWAAAIAGGLILLPKAIALISTVSQVALWAGQALWASTGALLGFAKGLITLTLGPVGLAVAGVAALVAAMSLLMGRGDTTVERLKTGFLSIVDTFDYLLGSWNAVTDFWMQTTNTVANGMRRAWAYVSDFIIQAWSHAVEYVGVGLFGTLGKLWEWGNQVKRFFTTLAEAVVSIWGKAVDLVGDEAGKQWALQEFRKGNMKGYKSEQEVLDYLEKMKANREESRMTERARSQAEAEKKFDEQMKRARDFGSMGAQGMRTQEAERRRKSRESRDAELEQIEQDRIDMDADIARRAVAENRQKLSERLKGMAGLMGGMVTGMMESATDIYNRLMGEAVGNAEKGPGAFNARRGGNDEDRELPRSTDVSSAFQNNAMFLAMKQADRQIREDEARRAAVATAKEAKRTADATEEAAGLLKWMLTSLRVA